MFCDLKHIIINKNYYYHCNIQKSWCICILFHKCLPLFFLKKTIFEANFSILRLAFCYGYILNYLLNMVTMDMGTTSSITSVE